MAFDLPLGERIYLINASLLPGGWDGAEAIIADAHNVTEQRAEARRQQDFLAMVTHDLKNPLTSVRAYAQLMQRRQRYDERAVATIVQQTHYLDLFWLPPSRAVCSSRLSMLRTMIVAGTGLRQWPVRVNLPMARSYWM